MHYARGRSRPGRCWSACASVPRAVVCWRKMQCGNTARRRWAGSRQRSRWRTRRCFSPATFPPASPGNRSPSMREEGDFSEIRPANTLVESTNLVGGYEVEIEAEAEIGQGSELFTALSSAGSSKSSDATIESAPWPPASGSSKRGQSYDRPSVRYQAASRGGGSSGYCLRISRRTGVRPTTDPGADQRHQVQLSL